MVRQEAEQLVQARGWSGAKATLAAEAGDTLTDIITPYLMYAPPPRGWSASSAPMGQLLLPADYWSGYMDIVEIASYEFPDENVMLFSY